MNLSVRKPHAQRIEQLAQLGLVDFAVGVGVDALEAFTQRIRHSGRLRAFQGVTKPACFALMSLSSCRATPEVDHQRAPAPIPTLSSLPSPVRASPPALHPAAPRDPGSGVTELAPLTGAWLEQLPSSERPSTAPPAAKAPSASFPVFIAPPLGATAPRPLIVAVHGAGDRPEWACGGWRLAAQANAFVVCPQGNPMTSQKFAWASPAVLGDRVLVAVARARERYGPYLGAGPQIFAGFSQGATYAEPFLRQHAAEFPIIILAEGGYRTVQSPAFARAFRDGGGRRVVLVCGGPACFAAARNAKTVLERAGLQTLVVGDPQAGHNLNERMQQALQAAWPDIAAELPAEQ